MIGNGLIQLMAHPRVVRTLSGKYKGKLGA